ncbi:MAG TPA: hypothetical protein VGX46_11635 [Vicinamibacterales bacterium]|nr:hypothetical protein [Vicinamibacterales bacterium]
MTFRLRFLAVVAIVAVTTPAPRAQKAPAGPPKKNPLLKLAEPWPEADVLEKRRVEAEARPLFKSADTLEFTLTAPFNIINKDHNPESTKRYPGVLTVAGADGTLKSIAVELSARGHFRRMARNCSTVPLRIEFTKGEAAGTVFAGQTTLKLGTGCESSKEFEQITLREYLTYPIYHMVTPLSFRARLARGTYVEEGSLKKTTPRYAIFIEQENDVARRNGGRIVNLQRISFTDLEPTTLTRTMLFEYMLGNTDMSIWALHNVRFVQNPARTLFVVPYDFDLSGIVHAPYAVPDRRLGLRSVVDRLYRGPCRTTEEFEAAAAPLRNKHKDMLALVDSIKDLDSNSRSEVKDYLESFFRTIDKPASIKKQFVDGCKPNPTM